MTSQRTKHLSYALFSLIGIFIVLSAFQKQHWDSDIFWALKSGQYIVENLKVPAADPFSYTFSGKEWIDFTWGFQVLAFLFFTHLGGWFGLFVLQVLLTGATLYFIYLNVELLSTGRRWLALLVIFLVYAGSHPRFFIRPHLFEYFFISLFLLLLNLYERNGRAVYVWALIPLQVVWVNVHSSAILGIFVAGAYAAGEIIDILRQRGVSLKAFTARAVNPVAAAVLLPIASLLNPYGLKLVLFPLVHMGGENENALRHIGEWTKTPANELLFYIYPFPLDHFAFEVLLIGALLSLIIGYRYFKSRDLIIFAGALYLSVSHVRWHPLFVYFAAPVLAANLRYLDAYAQENSFLKWGAGALNLFLAGAMAFNFSGHVYRENMGLGPKEAVYPEGTVKFMRKAGIKGNIFNDYIFGGYLIYHYPEMKVFIDGRTPTVYSPYFFWKARLINDTAAWKRLSSEYGIDTALVKLTDPFCNKLRNDRDWTAVNFDDVSALYLKNTGERKDIISRWGLTELNPCSDTPKYKLPKDTVKLRKMRDELKKVITLESVTGSYSRVHRLLGLVDIELSELGEQGLLDLDREAADELKKAVSIFSDSYNNYDLGVALGRLKKRDEAVSAFKAAIAREEGLKEAYLALGLAYHDMGDYKAAIKFLNRYVYMADDESEHIAYKTLGMSCFRAGRNDCAITYLKRAAWTADDPKELGSIYYYLGNVFFEEGNYKEGSDYYRKALDVEPEYDNVFKNLALQLKEGGSASAAQNIDDLLKEQTRPKKDTIRQ